VDRMGEKEPIHNFGEEAYYMMSTSSAEKEMRS
jgi:hypothetical protein